MTEDDGWPAEQRLFEAVARWQAEPMLGPAGVIDAACAALIEGLDCPALRELAGATPAASFEDVRELVYEALEQLDIPAPGAIPVGHVLAAGGGTVRRPHRDSLRLAIAPVPSGAGGGFEVQVYVNEVEMTSAGAGLGMDPYDLLIPANRLAATAEPHTVPIARCDCGIYGCGATDVTIVRDDDLVHWDWSIEVPMRRGASFAAREYDAEVSRVAADHTWETPERTAGRLVLTHLDQERLRSHGLRVSWVANDYRDPGLFQIALEADDRYQVFLNTPWRTHSPDQLAHEICAQLARPPQQWRATWSAFLRTTTTPPDIAGPQWQRRQI